MWIKDEQWNEFKGLNHNTVYAASAYSKKSNASWINSLGAIFTPS